MNISFSKHLATVSISCLVCISVVGCGDAEQQLNELMNDGGSQTASDSTEKSNSSSTSDNSNAQDSDASTQGSGNPANSQDSSGAGAMALSDQPSGTQTYGSFDQAFDAALGEIRDEQARNSVLASAAKNWLRSLDLSKPIQPPLFDISTLEPGVFGRADIRFVVGQAVSETSATGRISVGRTSADVILGNIDATNLRPRQKLAIPNQILLNRGPENFNTLDGQSGRAPYIVNVTADWNTMLKHVQIYQKEQFGLSIDPPATSSEDGNTAQSDADSTDEEEPESAELTEARQLAIDFGEMSQVLTDAGFRTWMEGTDREVIARLSKLSGDSMKLEKLDGETIELSKSSLPQEDQDFITKWIRKQ